MENNLCYCTNITSLGLPHNPSDWRLIIDSSKRNLKGVLLHNGNKYPNIPIAHCSSKGFLWQYGAFLEAIKYSEYQWILCWDLKVIGLLMGMQAGFTKYCCLLCLWDSRAVSQHYKQKTGALEALLFLVNTASRRILWWTWITCFFLLFTSSLVWWRTSWRRRTKMVLPSNTCLLCSQVLVLLSSKRASLSALRSKKCWRILILRSFLT